MHHLVWRCFSIIISKEYFTWKLDFIGLTVAAFGILSDAAGKYTVAKVSMTTAALSLACTCLEVFQCATYII